MIQVYVQELATYNNAVGVGKWISIDNFDSELEQLFEEATRILKENGFYYGVDAEEYEIFDIECDVDINLNHIYQNIDKLKELNDLLMELDQGELDKLCYLFDNGYDIEDITPDSFDNVYTYENWDSAIEEFIEYFLEVTDNSSLYNYIDYEKIQRDLEIDGYTEYNNKVYKEV